MENLTREERYLTAIATGDTAILPLQPITRVEVLLDRIANKPSGEGGGTVEDMTKEEMMDILRGESE